MASTTSDLIQAAYTEAEVRYITANPVSRAAHDAATANLPGGNTRSVLHWEPYPLCISSAAGYTLRDADGHAYVDLLGEYSAGLYGHSHPVLQAAITETVQRGLSYGGPHAAETRLAALIKDRFRSIEHIRFTNSGTEANLMALAAAKAFTGRYRGKVVVFDGAYHGGVFAFPFGCKDVWGPGKTGTKSKYEVLRALNAPHEFLVATYNDVASVDALIASAAEEEEDGGVAAILIEPMLGSGGGVCSTPEFLAHLRRRADEVGALLVFDEVMTSRMYAGGGVQSELGISPDLTTLGKYIGGGISFGAFGGRRDAVFTPEKARALHALGDEVRGRINGFRDDGATAGNRRLRVLGCGSILVIHITKSPLGDIASPADWKADEDPRLLDLFHLEMLNEGFYLARRGYIALNLALLEQDGRAELDRFVEAVRRFVVKFRDLIA
ncbi:hypothetical protein CIB48_g4662 [Xylaria polymorpha]|nr:hypothetical protein CIB48_g4662 [Xylaria polymorpha]